MPHQCILADCSALFPPTILCGPLVHFHLNFILPHIMILRKSCSLPLKMLFRWVPVVTQQKQTWVVSMRMQVWSLALFSGSGIWRCHELCCRSQMWLRSPVAVAVAQAINCSSDSTPSLGTSICCRCSPPKKGEKNPKTYQL